METLGDGPFTLYFVLSALCFVLSSVLQIVIYTLVFPVYEKDKNKAQSTKF